jgi:hypothetical protein
MYFDPMMYLTQVSLLAAWIFVCAGAYALIEKFIIGENRLPEDNKP